MSGIRSVFAGARITPGAMWILFITTGVSLVYLLAGEEIQPELQKWLIATGDGVWVEFKIWTLITSPLIETEFFQLILAGFMLWMFLPALERWWGTKRFVMFAIYTSVFGTLVGTLVGSLLGGMTYGGVMVTGVDTFVFAGIAAYGAAFPNQQVRFFGVVPLTGKQFTIGICLFVTLFLILGQDWVTGAAYVAGIGLAFVLTAAGFRPSCGGCGASKRRSGATSRSSVQTTNHRNGG